MVIDGSVIAIISTFALEGEFGGQIRVIKGIWGLSLFTDRKRHRPALADAAASAKHAPFPHLFPSPKPCSQPSVKPAVSRQLSALSPGKNKLARSVARKNHLINRRPRRLWRTSPPTTAALVLFDPLHRFDHVLLLTLNDIFVA
jgi:hypothetical protein